MLEELKERVGFMTRRAKPTLPPKNPGKPEGWKPTSEADHFEKCLTCGQMIDCRNLAEVMEHHGPAQKPLPKLTCGPRPARHSRVARSHAPGCM